MLRAVDTASGQASRGPAPDVADKALRAAREEYRALRQDVDRRRLRCEHLRSIVEHLEGDIARDEHMLAEMEEMLGLAPQMRLEHLDSRLTGRRILEVAVDLLRGQVGAGVPIHYRAWFELVRQAGHEVGGKDPLATFLAQVNRADVVESVGNRTGLYQLRAA